MTRLKLFPSQFVRKNWNWKHFYKSNILVKNVSLYQMKYFTQHLTSLSKICMSVWVIFETKISFEPENQVTALCRMSEYHSFATVLPKKKRRKPKELAKAQSFVQRVCRLEFFKWRVTIWCVSPEYIVLLIKTQSGLWSHLRYPAQSILTSPHYMTYVQSTTCSYMKWELTVLEAAIGNVPSVVLWVEERRRKASEPKLL